MGIEILVVIYVLLWIIPCMIIASAKNKSVANAFLASLLFGVFALIYYIFVSSESPKKQKKSNAPFGKIGMVIGIIILLFVAFRMCGGPILETSIEVTPELKTEQIIPDSQPSSSPETSKQEEKEPEVEVYRINEPVLVDYLTYTVTKAETFTEMGSEFMSKTTEGKFIKIYLKITNNAKETKDLFSSRFFIVDENARKFDRLSDDTIYISDGLEFGKQLQPGLSTSGAVVFELPTDVKKIGLVISGDWMSKTQKLIVIDSLRDIGTDTTLKEESQRQMDEAMKQGQEQMEKLMEQCNSPFKCSSSCPEYMDTGKKDCPTGQLCCLKN